MVHINALTLRFFTALQCVNTRRRNDLGQATSEYGVVILIAAALGIAVLALFTGGTLDGLLEGLLSGILNRATTMVS